MYTKGNWTIDGSQIVSVEKEISNSNETICELNPDTEYPTVFERSQKEALKNAKLIMVFQTLNGFVIGCTMLFLSITPNGWRYGLVKADHYRPIEDLPT